MFDMTINIILTVFIAAALISDLNKGRAPNAITVPAAAVGLIFYTLHAGTSGLLFSCGGLLAGIGLMIIPFAMGGIGGGDVKMLAAVGALKGAEFVLTAFLFGALAGGIIAAVSIVRNKKQSAVAANIKNIIMTIPFGDGLDSTKNTAAIAEKRAIPYAVAIAAGVAAAFIMPCLI